MGVFGVKCGEEGGRKENEGRGGDCLFTVIYL